MNRNGLIRFSVVAAVAILAVVQTMRAQEQARELTGTISAGYSQNDLNGDSAQGPYLGVQADLKGYYKDPRILTYEFMPNLAKGAQWSGPVAGPDTTGFAATSTFLGGSNIPLSMFVVMQKVPTTQLTGLANTTGTNSFELPSLSRSMRSWGLDWQYRTRGRLPSFSVHYSNTNTDDTYPIFLGGDLSSSYKHLGVNTQYRWRGWDLNAQYTNLFNSTQSPFSVDTSGNPISQNTRQRQATANAIHKLPFRSQILLTADWTNNSLNIAYGEPPTHNKYSRFMGSFSTNFWRRLTLGSNASYISSYSDYWRTALQAGSGIFLAQPALGAVNTSVLSLGETASLRLTKSLSANGSFNAMKPLNLDGTNIEPTSSFGGGLTYIKKIWAGDAAANYQFTRSLSNVETSAGELASTVSTHSISGTYARALPLAIRSRSTVLFTTSSLEQSIPEQFQTLDVSTTLERKVARWTAELRMGVGSQHIDYTTVTDSTNLNMGLGLRSRTLQLNATFVHVSGLAYVFGSSLVTAPLTELTVPGFNYLIRTTGNNLNVTADYSVTRKLEIQGGLLLGDRSTSSALPTAYSGYNVIATYRFRKITAVGGYVWNGQHVDSGTSKYYGRQMYFQIKRDFRLF